MKTWKVKLFPNGTVSDDGKIVTVEVEMEDGRTRILEMPFSQLDWLQQALLSLSRGAYERQVASGTLQGVQNVVANDTMKVHDVRVMANTTTRDILIQASGRSEPTEPLGMGSMSVDEEQARHLATRLNECAEQLR